MPTRGGQHGRHLGTIEQYGPIDWFKTLSRGRPSSREALIHRQRQANTGELLLVLLDCSASTLKGQALAQAKGALASLLELAYTRRARLGLVEFAGHGARLKLPPQRATRQTLALIEEIAGGGGTPLRKGLEAAIEVLRRERKRFAHEQQTLVLLTDGRSREDIGAIQPPCRTLLVDIEAGPVRLGRCRQLAERLEAEYLALDELPVVPRHVSRHIHQ